MKSKTFNLILFAVCILLLASCAPDPGHISTMEAFKHCLTLPGFVWFNVVLTLIFIAGAYFGYKKLDNAITIQNHLVMKLIFCVFFGVCIWWTWFVGPNNMAGNTTIEQAQRGVYIR